MEYDDFTVIFVDRKNITIEFQGRFRARKEDHVLEYDPLDKHTVERLNNWINFAIRVEGKESVSSGAPKNQVKAEDLKIIGLYLYRILFGNKAVENRFQEIYEDFMVAFKKAGPNGKPMRLRLRMIFTEQSREYSALPWEFLFIPGEGDAIRRGFFLGEKTELLLTRWVPPSPLLTQLLGDGPLGEKLRILLVICEPSGLAGFSDDIVQKVIEKIEEVPAEVTVVWDDKEKMTFQELRNLVGEEIKPHIFHFIGHGKPGHLALIMDPRDQFYDESRDENQEYWVSSEEFQHMFDNHKPRLVFLHACKGAVDSSQAGFQSVAQQLVYADIPAVVAMQYDISNFDAGIFVQKFYEQLAKGDDIDAAVQAGRLELGGRINPVWQHPRFGTPVVYLQSDLAIVLPFAEPEIVEEETNGTTTTTEFPTSLSDRGPATSTGAEITTEAPITTADTNGFEA